ncbi:hypothetical protein V500_06145 [Pseudogymnoascus sp. VKM F-4518 (FW-2643)]|nr:hypothetical protein V500_06145 [Pseudogymnoascus sp. VKM F-4518 (FW-2643)]
MVGRAPKKRRLRNQENQGSNMLISPPSDIINYQTVSMHASNTDGDNFLGNNLPDLSAEQFSVHDLQPGGTNGGTSQFSVPSLGPYTQHTDPNPDISARLATQDPGTTQNSLFSQSPDLDPLHNPKQISALGSSIACLDIHVNSKAIGIDEAMRVSKVCIGEVTKILSLGTYRCCRSCKTFISTIVELIVMLYEIASCSWESSSLVNNHPNLYFGVFQISFEEHPAIYKHIIRSSSVRIQPIVRTLSSGCGAEVGSDSRARHQQLFSDMEKQVQVLVSSLGA